MQILVLVLEEWKFIFGFLSLLMDIIELKRKTNPADWIKLDLFYSNGKQPTERGKQLVKCIINNSFVDL